MFIRQHFRYVNGQRKAYWALVESFRTEKGPKQRVVTWLGALDEAGRLGVLTELSEIRLVDVVLPTDMGKEIRTRCITRPSEHQKILLDLLGLRLPARIKSTEM